MQEDARFAPPERTRAVHMWDREPPEQWHFVLIMTGTAVCWMPGLWLLYRGAQSAAEHAFFVLYDGAITWMVTNGRGGGDWISGALRDLGVDVVRMLAAVLVLWIGARLYRSVVPLRSTAADSQHSGV